MNEKMTALEKVLTVLDAFETDSGGISTTELSKSLGIHKSSVSRIANQLTEHGYLLKNPQTSKYYLGRRIVSLGLSMVKRLNEDLIDFAKPFIDELRDMLGEAVTFAILYGTDVIIGYVADKYIDDQSGLMEVTTKLGKIHPLNTASSKAIFSYLSPRLIEEALQKGLIRYTENTIIDPEALKENLKTVKKQGYALDNEEVRAGINAVSVPVFDFMKKPVAAVSVIGLSRKFDAEKDYQMLVKLKATSEKIMEQFS
jgi:IclR family transcriptional regulator, KDG regulon repressor